jgi:hypothetical protein
MKRHAARSLLNSMMYAEEEAYNSLYDGFKDTFSDFPVFPVSLHVSKNIGIRKDSFGMKDASFSTNNLIEAYSTNRKRL